MFFKYHLERVAMVITVPRIPPVALARICTTLKKGVRIEDAAGDKLDLHILGGTKEDAQKLKDMLEEFAQNS
ncbi:hypothetical protein HZA26_00535 [Candidatus Nomurabacteria bacterium]|nr:hypothetical protein [Candidatus Nomurabacteria bacterium]